MYVYIKIRYLEPNEYELEQQVEFIRHYIEDVCDLDGNGFEYRGFFTTNENNIEKAVVKYFVGKKANLKNIEIILEDFTVDEEFIVFSIH